MEHLVTAQPHFLVVDRSHPRPLDWHFLPHHHAVAALAAPPVGRPFRLLLAALAGQFPNFFLHHQIHQLQAGLTYQCTHPFSNQPTISAIGSTICTAGFPSTAIASSCSTARCTSI